MGSAAQAAEASKRLKYAGLGSGYSFYTVAIETLGAWGKDAQGLVSELGGRLAALTGDPKSLAFLRQRLGIAMQRGNAAAVRGTCLKRTALHRCRVSVFHMYNIYRLFDRLSV